MTPALDCQVEQKSQHSLSRPGCEDPGQGYLPAGNNVPGYQVVTVAYIQIIEEYCNLLSTSCPTG